MRAQRSEIQLHYLRQHHASQHLSPFHHLKPPKILHQRTIYPPLINFHHLPVHQIIPSLQASKNRNELSTIVRAAFEAFNRARRRCQRKCLPRMITTVVPPDVMHKVVTRCCGAAGPTFGIFPQLLRGTVVWHRAETGVVCLVVCGLHPRSGKAECGAAAVYRSQEKNVVSLQAPCSTRGTGIPAAMDELNEAIPEFVC